VQYVSGPALVAVDEDVGALRDVERELRDRYARHYRIMCMRSSREARTCLEDLAAAGDEVALILAGQWLSGMTGSELLDEARHLHPHAKRGLLIAWGGWGDRATGEAIFDSIAHGRIDHYVLRPSASPDELFHQAISSLLLEWAEAQRASPYTIHVVGESWSGRSYELRDVLGRCAMPHSFCLADSNDGRALVAEAGEGAKLPIVVFPDGTVLTDPSDAELARAAGSPVNPERMDFDLVIVGAGPAGLSAAVYGASEGFSTLVVDEGGVGGQATSSSLIRNYLGFPRGVSGRRLAQQAYQQAWVFGANFAFFQKATDLRSERDRLLVTLSDSGRVRARAVLLATGASYRRLGVPALEALNGAGNGRSGRFRPRRRELGRTGCAVPRSLRQERHTRGTCSVARRRDVALPGTPGGGDAKAAGTAGHRDRRRRRRRMAGTPGASRPQDRKRGERRRRWAVPHDRSAPAY
jgi:thioredoxin reductase (NADPH)